jgi:signal transduction histidine kinase
VRGRIQWVGVLAAALAIGLFGVPLAVAVVVLFRSDERAELNRAADTTAVRLAPDLAAGRTPAAVPRSRDDVRVAVYGLDGRRLLGRGPDPADGPVRLATGGAPAAGTEAGDLVAAVPVTSGTRVVGVVRAASPGSRVWLQIGGAWAAMAGFAAVAVAAATLLARRQSRRLADPLVGLAGAAQTLGEGDFTVRLAPAGIAEIDAAGAALNRTAARLGELVARERAFSADASHQLRTPLTGLRLRLETALESGSDLAPAVRAALAGADRLERTIDELLALARDAPHARTPADLPALLAALRSDRDLRVTVEPGLPPTTASAAATQHILDVLVDNARRHGAAPITVTARDAGPAVAVDVADAGPGVADPDALFRRRDPGAAGHGIGLALARALAEAEGGRLVLARPGPGPVFTLLLPASPESAGPE